MVTLFIGINKNYLEIVKNNLDAQYVIVEVDILNERQIFDDFKVNAIVKVVPIGN